MRAKILAFLFLLTTLCSTAFAGITFDSADDSVETNTAVTMPTTLTMSLWVKFNSTGEGGFGRMLVFDNGTAAATTGLGLAAGIDIGFRADWTVTDLTDTFDTNLSTGVWYHVLVTYDGSAVAGTDALLYVNGTQYTNDSVSAGTITTSFNEIIIGNTGDGARTFDGQITEVAIWNVILNAAEINLLASSRVKQMPLQIRPSALFAYWPLDNQPDGTSFDGDTAKDLSANGRNAIGSDGANNTGLTQNAEVVLSYP